MSGIRYLAFEILGFLSLLRIWMMVTLLKKREPWWLVSVEMKALRVMSFVSWVILTWRYFDVEGSRHQNYTVLNSVWLNVAIRLLPLNQFYCHATCFLQCGLSRLIKKLDYFSYNLISGYFSYNLISYFITSVCIRALDGENFLYFM